jgi:hypothetical protein
MARVRPLLATIGACLVLAPAAEARVVTSTMPRDPARTSRWAWEPGMARGADGSIWAIGNHCALVDQHGACEVSPAAPLLSPDYTPLWRSRDGGRHYAWAGDPLRATELGALRGSFGSLAQDKPGGYDTDVAAAPVRRRGRPALLYAVSAWEGSSSLAVSADDGRTWSVTSLTGIPVQDRPWLATGGPCDLYMQYHPLTGAYDVAAVARVDRYDGCALTDRAAAGQTVAHPDSSTLVEPASDEATQGNSVMGKIAAVGGHVYVAYLACDTPGAGLDCSAPGDRQSLHLAVSSDRAAHFRDMRLPDAHLDGPLDDGVWPVAAAADARGGVAVAVTDTRHVRLWTSSSYGWRWKLRGSTIDGSRQGYATVPTVALAGRHLAVAWYGSPPAVRGRQQRWRLTVARSTDGGARLTRTALDPVLATTASGEPLGDALYDDFGALITSRGELASTYTESCDGHRASDRTCPPAGENDQAHAEVIRSAWLPAPPTSRRPAPRRRRPSPNRREDRP